MKKLHTALIVTAISLLSLAGCDQSYEDQVAELTGQLSKGAIGSGPDFWVEKFNAVGQWEKTMLVFGYMDDYSACEDAIKGLMIDYPDNRYRCVPAQ